MGKRVECLKVGEELYEIGDIVEIPIKECDGEHVYKGRISGFEEVGNKHPLDICVILDTSTLFNQRSTRIYLDDIKKASRVN